MTTCILVVESSDIDLCDYSLGIGSLTVRVLPESEFRASPPHGGYRCSPIFPVSDRAEIPVADGTYKLLFLSLRTPFQAIRRMVARDPDFEKKLWYSLGNCSLLIVDPSLEIASAIGDLLGEEPTAEESWMVSGGVLVSAEPRRAAAATVDVVDYTLSDYAQLDISTRGVVDEFKATLDSIVRNVAQHLQDELPTFKKLVVVARELTSELVFLETGVPPVPDGLKAYGDSIGRDAFIRLQLKNQRIDQLVQINSALSYVSSQAFHGGVPILAAPSLIRHFSLLGVGTAYRALVAIVRRVEMALEEWPIEEVVTSYLPFSRGLPGFTDPVAYDPSRWNEVCGVDHYLAKVENRGSALPKLPYFSGRLGFRETQFAISAALQLLFAGDGREWHLITMTHEIMHGHVRNLLGRIFGADASSSVSDTFHSIYERYAGHLLRQIDDSELTAIDSIRSVILTYCALSERLGSLTLLPAPIGSTLGGGKEILGDLRLWPEEQTWRLLKREFRNINELLVLVLDLHYAYRSDLDQYLQHTWRTWPAVPGVLSDVRQYVLRSIFAAASMSESRGPLYQRFDDAIRHVVSALRPIAELEAPHGLLHSVIERLEKAEPDGDLLPAFVASIRVVDLAKHVFFSNHVRGAMFSGDITDDATAAANPEPGVFEDLPIGTPFPILAKGVSRALAEEPRDTLERDTAWLLLACASSLYLPGETT